MGIAGHLHGKPGGVEIGHDSELLAGVDQQDKQSARERSIALRSAAPVSVSPASTVVPTSLTPKWRLSKVQLSRSCNALPSLSSDRTTYQRRNPARTYQPARASRYIAALGWRWNVIGRHMSLRNTSAWAPTFTNGMLRCSAQVPSAIASGVLYPPIKA
jgi:hypothetical protein